MVHDPYASPEKNPGSTEDFMNSRANQMRFKELSAAHETMMDPAKLSPEMQTIVQRAGATVVEAANSAVPTKGPNATN